MTRMINAEVKAKLLKAATKWEGSEPVSLYVLDEDTIVTIHNNPVMGNWTLVRTFMISFRPMVSVDATSRKPADIFKALELQL